MDEADLRALLEAVRAGALDPDTAVARLRRLPFTDMGFARVDHHRALRTGLPEAVYGPGKTPEQCAALVGELLAGGTGPVLLTRADRAQVAAARAAHPGGVVTGDDPALVAWRPAAAPGAAGGLAPPGGRASAGSEGATGGLVPPGGRANRARPRTLVVVAAAGTADLPVADECAATLTALGLPPRRLTDVGVAGLHRLLAEADLLARADAVVVVAGMEGALASVVGGLTRAPVVAVPTSAGYGASLDGVTALLAMLASCSAGITVVGIDNGFGAACAVHRLLGPSAATSRARPTGTGKGEKAGGPPAAGRSGPEASRG